MSAMKSVSPPSIPRPSTLTHDAEIESDGIPYNAKMKVDCICPKCDRKHVMAFHWIGRGIPRKYCPSCKGSYLS